MVGLAVNALLGFFQAEAPTIISIITTQTADCRGAKAHTYSRQHVYALSGKGQTLFLGHGEKATLLREVCFFPSLSAQRRCQQKASFSSSSRHSIDPFSLATNLVKWFRLKALSGLCSRARIHHYYLVRERFSPCSASRLPRRRSPPNQLILGPSPCFAAGPSVEHMF